MTPEPTVSVPTEAAATPLPFVPDASAAGIPARLAQPAERLVDFASGESAEFHLADGYSNGSVFDCTWRKANGSIENGVLSLSVTEAASGYDAAEYRTESTRSYGFFATRMKPIRCSGVISSFFVYTGSPWDEIDVEFLGKDTTQVQFNYYVNGVGGHEYVLDLGFDAAEDFHEYAFLWQPDAITWFVDGVAVYRVEKANGDLPSHPMQIMANAWNCKGADAWSGRFDPSLLPVSAQYEWIAYYAE